MSNCVNHPERTALEHCEVCGNPLCGYCLYYTDDGQRLCEIHAQQAKVNGAAIIPPAVYAQGIIPSQATAKRSEEKGVMLDNPVLYRANNQDLTAFLAMVLGLLSLLSCCGASMLIPFLAPILGIIALINAKDAVDKRRTRQQAWIGILTGGMIALVIALCIGCYALAYGSIIASFSANSNYTPFIFPSSTYTQPAPTIDPQLEPADLTATAKAP